VAILAVLALMSLLSGGKPTGIRALSTSQGVTFLQVSRSSGERYVNGMFMALG
jgi:hypothetical protein